MKIQFDKVRYKNFLSVGNSFTEFNLSNHKTILIVGDNGSGKSILLDAICFALFGKPYRKANKPTLVNSINDKNLLVELEFVIAGKKYLIKRGIKPAIFELYANGVLVSQTASIKDYQNYLESNILKLNYRSFTQLVVLGSSLFIPFMSLTAQARREIIEDLLDIKVFSVMNALAKEKLAANKTELDSIERKIEVTQDKINFITKYIKNKTSENQDKHKEVEKQIADIVTNISEKKLKLDEFDNDIETLRKGLNNDIDELLTKQNNMKIQLESRRSMLLKQIEFFDKTEDCPTCSQNISPEIKEEKKTDLTAKEHKILEGIDELGRRITENQLIKENNTSLNQQINKAILDRYKIETEIENLEKLKKVLDGTLETFKVSNVDSQETTETSELDNYNSSLASFLSDKNAIVEQREVINSALFLLKDSGIKTNIIKQYIPLINGMINQYLYMMDFYINFELDENFEEKIKSRYRDVFSYENFSEGEKQRINLALLFTWRNIARIKSSIDVNLLMMDEIFDSSLDEDGIESLLKIIRSDEISNSSNVFIISHRNGLEDKFDKVYKVFKRNNFTEVEDI